MAFRVMSSRTVARVAEAVFRGLMALAVLMAVMGDARREYAVGPFHATNTQLFFGCVFVSMAAGAIFVFSTPPEVRREDAAVLAGRGGRIVGLLSLPFVFIAMISQHLGDEHDQLAQRISEASLLIGVVVFALLEPFYRALRKRRRDHAQ